MNATIITLPETTENTICLQLTGMITAEDFTTLFDMPVQKAVEAKGY